MSHEAKNNQNYHKISCIFFICYIIFWFWGGIWVAFMRLTWQGFPRTVSAHVCSVNDEGKNSGSSVVCMCLELLEPSSIHRLLLFFSLSFSLSGWRTTTPYFHKSKDFCSATYHRRRAVPGFCGKITESWKNWNTKDFFCQLCSFFPSFFASAFAGCFFAFCKDQLFCCCLFFFF